MPVNYVLCNKWSRVKVLKNKDIVIKEQLLYRDAVFPREVGWLKIVKGSNKFPALISYDDKKYTMTLNYCGERINKKNCPVDYKKQIIEILDELKKYNCAHNDIKPEDILVKNGKMTLIDFGWATHIGDVIPDDWPKKLGGAFKLGVHKFDDKYSFEKSMEYILNNKHLIR